MLNYVISHHQHNVVLSSVMCVWIRFTPRVGLWWCIQPGRSYQLHCILRRNSDRS